MCIIVDYGMGNLNSVKRKISLLGIDAIVTSDPDLVLKSKKIILPGVGHFAKAVENIKSLKLFDALSEAVLVKKTPILGICLGMQLMANQSEEGNVSGFGWIDAEVIRFNVVDSLKYKIPHMGWNNVGSAKNSKLFDGIPSNSEFYFVHSYHIKANKHSDVLATTEYEYPFTCAFEKENIFGVQFHPEKSHAAGEKLFENFLKI